MKSTLGDEDYDTDTRATAIFNRDWVIKNHSVKSKARFYNELADRSDVPRGDPKFFNDGRPRKPLDKVCQRRDAKLWDAAVARGAIIPTPEQAAEIVREPEMAYKPRPNQTRKKHATQIQKKHSVVQRASHSTSNDTKVPIPVPKLHEGAETVDSRQEEDPHSVVPPAIHEPAKEEAEHVDKGGKMAAGPLFAPQPYAFGPLKHEYYVLCIETGFLESGDHGQPCLTEIGPYSTLKEANIWCRLRCLPEGINYLPSSSELVTFHNESGLRSCSYQDVKSEVRTRVLKRESSSALPRTIILKTHTYCAQVVLPSDPEGQGGIREPLRRIGLFATLANANEAAANDLMEQIKRGHTDADESALEPYYHEIKMGLADFTRQGRLLTMPIELNDETSTWQVIQGSFKQCIEIGEEDEDEDSDHEEESEQAQNKDGASQTIQGRESSDEEDESSEGDSDDENQIAKILGRARKERPRGDDGATKVRSRLKQTNSVLNSRTREMINTGKPVVATTTTTSIEHQKEVGRRTTAVKRPPDMIHTKSAPGDQPLPRPAEGGIEGAEVADHHAMGESKAEGVHGDERQDGLLEEPDAANVDEARSDDTMLDAPAQPAVVTEDGMS